MLPNPPPGWSELQIKARAAKTSHELTEIIDEMNRLLSTYEKGIDNRDSSDEHPVRKSGVQSTLEEGSSK